MEVDVVVTGDRQASALLERLHRRLYDGTPQLLGLVDMLIEVERQRFAGRNVRWKRLAPATIRQHGAHPRLVLTGALMRSLTIRGARNMLVEVTPTGIRFGTRIYYARFLKAGSGGRPKRNPVGITKPQKKTLVNELRDLLLTDKP